MGTYQINFTYRDLKGAVINGGEAQRKASSALEAEDRFRAEYKPYFESWATSQDGTYDDSRLTTECHRVILENEMLADLKKTVDHLIASRFTDDRVLGRSLAAKYHEHFEWLKNNKS